MLRILIGKAGTGKTAALMDEIRASVERRESGIILLVPEQYSHEAERELCAVCGDALSLCAEVLSFTGLARRVSDELGGNAARTLDKGGRLLCMALTVDALYSRLRAYADARRKPELQTALLNAVTELKTACIDPGELMRASEASDGTLSDKLHDMALLTEGFDAVVAAGHADPEDRLSVLAEQLSESRFCEGKRVYVDGFSDFTVQERRVLEAMLLGGAELTVCLGCDGLSETGEVFAIPRATARTLLGFAEENKIQAGVTVHDGDSKKAPALSYFTDRLFTFSHECFDGDGSAVRLYTAPDPDAECELAAATALALVRDTGCRWRDIAVAVRGFDDYRSGLENAFERYGVPLYSARKTDMFQKPLPAFLASVYELVNGGWETEDVLDCLKTGLTGLTLDECDKLENYIFKWQLRGSAWTKNEDWTLAPGFSPAEEAEDELILINALRRRFSAPLLRFAQAAQSAGDARGQAQALSQLFTDLGLSERLESISAELIAAGRAAAAQEYAQLWDIAVAALEQCAMILGDTALGAEDFGRLYLTTLSRFEIGTIPAVLDCVTAGDFDRMRRRSIKHLIVLGMTDERLPRAAENAGVFSQDERKRLLELCIDIGGTGDAELWREFLLIHSCLTLPSETLTLCRPELEGGEAARSSFVLHRAELLFAKTAQPVSLAELRIGAPTPALYLAANALRGGGTAEASAQAVMEELMPERMSAIRTASEKGRGSLSAHSVRTLYGKNLRLSASRIDKFASCRFAYFMQYGLKAKPHSPAVFAAPDIGIFMHYILENTAREIMEKGGFGSVSDAELMAVTDKYTAAFVREKLNDFRDKSRRFTYLFRRLVKEVRQIVLDMAHELKCSDFAPLSFELDFGNAEALPPLNLGGEGDSLVLTGIADRVDGWLHEGKLYLRVVDYKTGHKSFSLSDVWYGRGLQMLLYLFALGENGKLLYGEETVPAGVMYLPAREEFLSVSADADDEEIAAERSKKLRRSGLVLDDPAVLNAMEHGEDKRYIPVTVKNGTARGDALATAERLGLLSGHIEKTLRSMAQELKNGSIAADPFYLNEQENACRYCDYKDACHFADGENGEKKRETPHLKATKVWSLLEGGEENA